MDNLTNPQPSGNPLNLTYKGVFSTRLSMKKKSLYSHYLDKLYQVQFLGIGTIQADILHGVIDAVMLRQTSIDGKVELYKATHDKYNESVILEALGGTPNRLQAGLHKEVFSEQLNVVEPVTLAEPVSSSRLSVLKSAGAGNPLLLMTKGEALGLLEDSEEARKIVFDALNEHAKNKLFTSHQREADINDDLTTSIKLVRGEVGAVSDGEVPNLNAIELVDEEGKVVRRSDIIVLDSFTSSGDEANVLELYTIADQVKIEMSAFMLETIMQKPSFEDNMLLITDMDSMGVLIRSATVVAETLYLAEKTITRALVERFPVAANKSTKIISLAHYILYSESPDYRKIIDAELLKYVDSRGVSGETVLETMRGLGKDIVEHHGTIMEVTEARKIVDGILSSDSDIGSLHLLNLVGEGIGYRFIGSGKVASSVSINFDHEVQAEDSKTFLSVLETLYEDFKSIDRHGDIHISYMGDVTEIRNDALIVEHLLGISSTELNKIVTESDTYLGSNIAYSSSELNDVRAYKVLVKEGSVLDQDRHGELWSDTTVYVTDSRDGEIFGELASADEPIVYDHALELVSAELTSEEPLLSYGMGEELFGELIGEPQTLVPDREYPLWGDLTNEQPTSVFAIERELFGELTNEPAPLQPELQVEITGVKITDNTGFTNKEYEIAVLGCSEPDLKYRRRLPLEPDKEPPEPLFEWICTEGYVCDDWLIVPLKDFNFENPDQEGFFDPTDFSPYFPTGQVDLNGDPFVLPPYSILNEPLSNGADVGGKSPMAIDPCNLYSFIEYTVKIYDAYKSRFQASSPIDTMSRVMNMLFEQVQKLLSEWDETKGYTPDELWRIYRFIRWMALGMTNRFYRVKIVYTYGDFAEQFEVHPFTGMITTEGSARKNVNGYGWVLEGHPILSTMQNKAAFKFNLPQKTRSSTISFELGHVIPDRPDDLVQGGVIFQEDFEGRTNDFKIRGSGWVPVNTQGGTSLGVESPARAMTYRTSPFNVSGKAVNPRLSFNYGIDTNMNTSLVLKNSNGNVVWRSSGIVNYGVFNPTQIVAGDYYFEVNVPQAESGALTDLNFTAQQIQNEWSKEGYVTEWKVVGNTIYEDENTPGMALVVNHQWIQDNDYEMEVEFSTEDIPENYWLIDWLGVVLNYKDADNYYLFGTWSSLDSGAYGGLTKVVGGVGSDYVSIPRWRINPDFRFKLSKWHKLKAVVKGNKFTIYIDGTKYLDITDSQGWGHGACGLAAISNPKSSFRNFKYRSKPRINAFIDNVKVEAPNMYVPVGKPKYAIDFYLDGTTPRIQDYLSEGKRAYSFPIMVGEHEANWVFKKKSNESSVAQDASFIDNIVVRGMKVEKAEVVEEFISCGGHLAVKLLIENLLEYYRRHHQGCKGERNIWIVE